jgi:hypothetical protein
MQVSYSMEHNELHNKLTDSVSLQSFSFNTIQASLKSAEDKPNKWGISYFTRADAYPLGTELVKADRSQNVTLFTELLKNDNRQLRFSTTYRNLKVKTVAMNGLKSDQSLLGRSEYQFNEWKGLVTGNILYEIGSGQEQKETIPFWKFRQGRGVYME